MRRFDIVTVSREFGAGGSELAWRLGARLAWPVIDRDILERTAERLHVEAREVEHADEYARTLWETVGATLYLGAPECSPYPTAWDIEPDRLAQAEHALVRAAAASPPVILVGHGAQCVLRGAARALHVHLVAPAANRARRIAARAGISEEAALTELRRRDRERKRYLRHHFACDQDELLLYGLVINTGVVPVRDAVALVSGLVEPPELEGGAPERVAQNA
jgi:cytidylate kinase